MCVISVVHDFTAKWIPVETWTPNMLSEYEEILRRLEEIDKKLNLPECNPDKARFLEQIRERLDSIEEKISS